jgi:major membrane immunogen (membrane-anchored lipoprotein)
MLQFIESVETENFVNDFLQAQQQQESQYQTIEVKTVEKIVRERQQLQSPEQEQLLSIDSPIKMVDIYDKFYVMQEELKWSVISEIEGQIIEPVADYKLNDGTMESEQICADSIKKFDTFRGGTESLLYNASAIIFQESDNKMLEIIMVGAQTAKQFQSNDQKNQDYMKGNPQTGVERKTQKSVKFQIGEDKFFDAYVTHWQELETHNRVQQWQEQEQQDQNFRHGAENSSHDYARASTRPTVSRLAGV